MHTHVCIIYISITCVLTYVAIKCYLDVSMICAHISYVIFKPNFITITTTYVVSHIHAYPYLLLHEAYKLVIKPKCCK